VTATWAREGSIVAIEEACNEERLWRDHVGVLRIFARDIPTSGRVVIRLGMKKEDCPDCFQDQSDGEWTLLSP
jgi:hypothetical protein